MAVECNVFVSIGPNPFGLMGPAFAGIGPAPSPAAGSGALGELFNRCFKSDAGPEPQTAQDAPGRATRAHPYGRPPAAPKPAPKPAQGAQGALRPPICEPPSRRPSADMSASWETLPESAQAEAPKSEGGGR